MATGDVWAGLRNWRLQGSMLASTYVAFPVLGLLVQLLPDAVLASELKTGLLYLALLPSTVQSSVVFTSIARGNVAGAITGATISNVVGIVLTPLLVAVLMVRTAAVSGSNVTGILLQLLLPFALGQLVQRWIGPWLRARAAAHPGHRPQHDRARRVHVGERGDRLGCVVARHLGGPRASCSSCAR